MAAFLLAGANNVKAGDNLPYNNSNGSYSVDINFGQFDSAEVGDILRVSCKITNYGNEWWHPDWKIKLTAKYSTFKEISVTEDGDIDIALDDNFFSSINTTDQNNNALNISGADVAITKIELVSGATPGPHAINIAENITNGVLTSDKTSAEKDETVTLTAVSAVGYKLKNFIVNSSTSKTTISSVSVNADGTITTIGTFAMPGNDANVSAEFIDKNILYQGDGAWKHTFEAYEFALVSVDDVLRVTCPKKMMKLITKSGTPLINNNEWIYDNDPLLNEYYDDANGCFNFTITSTMLGLIQEDGLILETYNNMTSVVIVPNNSTTPSAKTDVTLTYSATTASASTASIGQTLTDAPTLTVSPEGLEGITYSSSAENVATIATDGTVTIVGAGTTTITATFAETDTYKGASAYYTLTVFKQDVILAFSSETASAKMEQPFIAPTLTVTPEGLEGITYSSSNTGIATVANDGIVTLVAAGNTTITASFAENAIYNAASASYLLTIAEADVPTFTVTVAETTNGQISTSPTTDVTAGTTVTITATPSEGYKLSTITVTGADETNVELSGTGNTRTFTMPSQNVTVSATFAEIETIEATITSTTGFATFCSNKALDFTGINTIEAYYAKTVENGNVYLLRIYGTVKAGTGLVLKGATTRIPVAESGDELEGNMLIGVSADTDVNASTDYVLTEKNGVAVFAQTGVNKATVAAGHAYLRVPVAQARTRAIGIGGEGTTGIDNTFIDNCEQGEMVIYNLGGQRVKNAAKGLFIINGKKKILK